MPSPPKTGPDRPPIYAAMVAEFGQPGDPPPKPAPAPRKPARRKARKPTRRKARL